MTTPIKGTGNIMFEPADIDPKFLKNREDQEIFRTEKKGEIYQFYKGKAYYLKDVLPEGESRDIELNDGSSITIKKEKGILELERVYE
jgi:hypothetical protein